MQVFWADHTPSNRRACADAVCDGRIAPLTLWRLCTGLWQMIATDKLRNSTREALTAIRKSHKEPKAWLQNSSNSLRRCTTADAIATLEQGVLPCEFICLLPVGNKFGTHQPQRSLQSFMTHKRLHICADCVHANMQCVCQQSGPAGAHW